MIYVKERPGAKNFIKKMSEFYELIIFTASKQEVKNLLPVIQEYYLFIDIYDKYANPVIDEIDPDHNIKKRLFRQNCTFNGFNYIKNLSLLERDLRNIIIIDV